MDTRLLIFKTVADLQSFSRAAEVLHISQPAISHNIQALEEYYGCTLFHRSTRQVMLSNCGKILYQYAKQLLNLYETAAETMQEMNHVPRGKLSLGASQTIGDYVVPQLTASYAGEYPQIQILAEIANTTEIIARLHNHSIQMALVEFYVDDPTVRLKPFMDDKLVLITHPSHPWHKGNHVTLEKLVTQPFIIREEGSGTRQVVEDNLLAAGVAIKDFPLHIVLGSNQAVKVAVQSGLGIAVLSNAAVERECEYGLLARLEIEGLSIKRKFYTANLKGDKPDLPTRLFLDLLKQKYNYNAFITGFLLLFCFLFCWRL